MGPVLAIIALVVVIPVSVIMTGGIAAGVISHFVRTDVEKSHDGSELLELNS